MFEPLVYPNNEYHILLVWPKSNFCNIIYFQNIFFEIKLIGLSILFSYIRHIELDILIRLNKIYWICVSMLFWRGWVPDLIWVEWIGLTRGTINKLLEYIIYWNHNRSITWYSDILYTIWPTWLSGRIIQSDVSPDPIIRSIWYGWWYSKSTWYQSAESYVQIFWIYRIYMIFINKFVHLI